MKYFYFVLFILIAPKLLICQNLIQNNQTQKSNYFITKTSSNKIFISSLEGLNINDGLNTKLYSSTTHNMYGLNIQSKFYENSLEEVWFVTYEAINVYKPKSDDLEHYFISNNNGDTIKSDYKVIHQIGDSILIRASENLYVFDTKLRKSIKEISINLEGSWNEEFYLYQDSYRLISSLKEKVYTYELSMDFDIKNRDSVLINAVSCSHVYDDICMFGTVDGEIILYDFNDELNKYSKKLYPGKSIFGLAKLNKEKLLITSYDEKLFVFDAINKQVIDSMVLKAPLACDPYSSFLLPTFDRDSTLWIGVDGIGVLNLDFKKEKFGHLLKFGSNEANNKITSIKLNGSGDKFAIGTRGNGLYILNSNLELIDHFIVRPFIINCFWLNDLEILFHYSNII